MAVAPGFQSTFLGQKIVKKPTKKKNKKTIPKPRSSKLASKSNNSTR